VLFAGCRSLPPRLEVASRELDRIGDLAALLLTHISKA
jgi:hypothetical protein